MKTLLISGDTLQEWDFDQLFEKTNELTTKQQVERILLYNQLEKERVKEFYENSYLELEYNKSI
jgi:hypothetical protein